MITNKVKRAFISGMVAVIAAIKTIAAAGRAYLWNVDNSNAEANARDSTTVNVNTQDLPVTPQVPIKDYNFAGALYFCCSFYYLSLSYSCLCGLTNNGFLI
jgi:hypothetical protein